jgi:DNA-binding MarR family transcriptional regulator
MEQDLNNIMRHLSTNQSKSFLNRTKRSLRNRITLNTMELECCLDQLSRNGYIDSYMHPAIGLIDRNVLESDLKVFYSLSNRGQRYLESIEAGVSLSNGFSITRFLRITWD